jgi:predicted dienelactone hydrolase
MSGHSFGGQTTLRVAALDARVRAGLALAPAAIPGLVIRRPLMVYTGSLDSLVPFDTAARASYAEATGIRFLIRLEDAGHCAFIPVCVPLLCGLGCPPVGIPQVDANRLVLRYAVPFVLRYVARRPGFTRLLEPASEPPGVTMVDAVLRR